MTRPPLAWFLVPLVALCACSDGASTDRPPSTSTSASTPPPLALTVTDATRRLEVEVPPSPRFVNLRVDAVDNPRQQSFGVAVAVELDGVTREVGQASPYPVDTGGAFVLRLSDDVADALRDRDRDRVTVVVTLASAVASKPLVEPLKVTVAPPVLSA